MKYFLAAFAFAALCTLPSSANVILGHDMGAWGHSPVLTHVVPSIVSVTDISHAGHDLGITGVGLNGINGHWGSSGHGLIAGHSAIGAIGHDTSLIGDHGLAWPGVTAGHGIH